MKFTYINILPDDVRELVAMIGQENIFKLVFEDVSFSKKYCSPFREDKNPGCFFKVTESNRICFVDYADTDRKYYDCINAIEKKFGLTYSEAVNYIRDTFSTKDLSANEEKIKDTVITEVEIKERTIKPIQFSERGWNSNDMYYWKPYGITKAQLIGDEVHPVELYSVMSREGVWNSSRPHSVAYSYLFPNGRMKIYIPNASDKRFKWFTNCLPEDLGNINNIDAKGNNLIITKSYKDCRVLRNLGYKNSIWVQGETQLPPIEMLLDLMNRFKTVTILFDNDIEGNTSSEKLTALINELIPKKGYSICIPEGYNKKDISDFYKQYGKERTENLIKELLKNKH